jgi:hypothetical protein
MRRGYVARTVAHHCRLLGQVSGWLEDRDLDASALSVDLVKDFLAEPGTPERMTHTCVRNGTTSLFAALDPTSGSMIAHHYRRHRHQEFLRFLKLIDASVPKEYDLHLILDNYATHKTPAVQNWLLRHRAQRPLR